MKQHIVEPHEMVVVQEKSIAGSTASLQGRSLVAGKPLVCEPR